MKHIKAIFYSLIVILSFLRLDAQRLRCQINQPSIDRSICRTSLPRVFSTTLPQHTRKFLVHHCCEVNILTSFPRTNGIARLSWAFVRCRDLRVNTHATVVCNGCFDQSGQKLSGYVIRPRLWEKRFTTRLNCTESVEIPVSCNCVPN